MTSTNTNAVPRPEDVVAWFENQSGARVVVTKLGDPRTRPYAREPELYTWKCLGQECDAPAPGYYAEPATESDAIDRARTHACDCDARAAEVASHVDRALLQLGIADTKARWNDHHPASTDDASASAQVGAGHALLAIAEELESLRAEARQAELSIRLTGTGIRHELAQLTGAVRELTATLAKPEPLIDIANAVSDVANLGDGIADMATAVESLVSSLDEQPRRRLWFGRRASKEARA